MGGERGEKKGRRWRGSRREGEIKKKKKEKEERKGGKKREGTRKGEGRGWIQKYTNRVMMMSPKEF